MIKTIDFSKGILNETLNENFQYLDDELNKERLSVGGYGIAYGLAFAPDKLKLSIDSGTVVFPDGNALHLNDAQVFFDAPDTVQISETVDVKHDGKIFLKYVPYAKEHSAYSPSDITIMIADTPIAARLINRNEVTIDVAYAGQMAIVTYRYALIRYDHLCIDKHGAYYILKGISSLAPSIRPVEDFCVLCAKIHPHCTIDENEHYYAGIIAIKRSSHYRNIYTSTNNELYIKGKPLDEFGIIHFTKPSFPEENTLYYDRATNKLQVYYSNEWIAMGDPRCIPIKRKKVFQPNASHFEEQDHKYTYIFHKTNDMDMLFVPGLNQLDIVIDQYPLFYDQYEEIIYSEAIKDTLLNSYLVTQGYTGLPDPNLSNTGIGFKLIQPSEEGLYIEAQVTHNATTPNVNEAFQRSATFCEAGSIIITKGEKLITFETPYRFNENQLQLMTDTKNLFSPFDYDEVGTTTGELCTQVLLTQAFSVDTRLHYRINHNIYSYDHVQDLIKKLVEEEVKKYGNI